MAPKPIRRVVTTHHGATSAVMIDDNVEPLQSAGGGDRVLWQSHEAPAVLTKDGDIADNSQGFYAKGSLIRVVDIAPHSKGFNHRTASLDYGIIMEGELEMLLDDGSKTRVKAGDVVVQRATMHQWDNPTDKPARVYFVLLPAVPPVVDGMELGDHGLPKLHPEGP